MCVCAYMHVYVHMYVYLYVGIYGCTCVNVCLYMCILFYILSDCVCFMDIDISTADGDLIVLVYISVDIVNHILTNEAYKIVSFRYESVIQKKLRGEGSPPPQSQIHSYGLELGSFINISQDGHAGVVKNL